MKPVQLSLLSCFTLTKSPVLMFSECVQEVMNPGFNGLNLRQQNCIMSINGRHITAGLHCEWSGGHPSIVGRPSSGYLRRVTRRLCRGLCPECIAP
jgi:hypothetical protein